jgi:hypothetical protein
MPCDRWDHGRTVQLIINDVASCPCRPVALRQAATPVAHMTMSSRQSCTPPGQLFKHVVEMVEGLGEEGSGHEQRPKVDKHYHDTVQMTLTIPGVTLAPSLHYPLTPLLLTLPTLC